MANGEPIGIGEELRLARVRRGRSIAQAHQATRIARHYLEAMEEEDWSRMPAAPFARGFLSSYAQYLGLDEGPLLERFPFEPSVPGDGLGVADPYNESCEAAERASGRSRDDLQPSRVQLGPWLAAALVVLVIIAGVVAVVSLREEVQPVAETREVPGIDTSIETLEQLSAAESTSLDVPVLPDLGQFSSREAINYVKLLNAPFVIVEVFDDSPEGTLIEQSPAPGAEPEEDAVITLVISSGPRPGATPAPADTDTGTDTDGADSADAAAGGE